MDQRECRTCGLVKPSSDFYSYRERTTHKDCKTCFSHKRLVYYYQKQRSGLCRLCGQVPPRERYKTCADCVLKERRHSAKRIRGRKRRIVEYLGGQCSRCGFKSEHLCVYDCHHRETEEKDFGIAQLIKYRVTWDELVVELDKCELLCANCHRIHHYANME